MTNATIIEDLINSTNTLSDELHASLDIQREIERQNLSTKERKSIIDRINLHYGKYKMLMSLLKKVVEEKDIDFAISLIAELPDTEHHTFYCRYGGQRLLLMHYAQEGDLNKFIDCLKKCKPGRFPKNEVISCKSKMVETFSKHHGYEKGLEICKNKIFGDKFCMATIEWMAHLLSIEKIISILDNNTIYTQVEPNARAILLVLHFSNQPRPIQISQDEFLQVMNEISQIDKKIRAGDGRLRDWLYCDLASSTHDFYQIKECKKMIIDPFYKKELNYHIENIKSK